MAIRVILEDQYGSIRRLVKIDETATVGRLIHAIVATFELPLSYPSSQPITYHLSHNNRRLQENESLKLAEVQENDTITIVPEMSLTHPAVYSEILLQNLSSAFKLRHVIGKAKGLEQSERKSTTTLSQPRYPVWEYKKAVHRVAWAPNGQFVAFLARDGTIELWNAETGQQQQLLTAPPKRSFGEPGELERSSEPKSSEGSIEYLGVPDDIYNTLLPYIVKSLDDTEIFTSGSKSTLLGNTGTRPPDRMISVVPGPKPPDEPDQRRNEYYETAALAWSPDGKMIALGSNAAWSPDGTMLAYSLDDYIWIWDIQIDQHFQLSPGHTGKINSLAWSPNGQMLASGSSDQSIMLWDRQTWQIRYTLAGNIGDVNSVVWSPDNRVLVSASDDHTIRLWNPETGQQTYILAGHPEVIVSLAFSSNGHLLASQSHTGLIQFWRTDTWQAMEPLNEPSSQKWITSLAFHPNALALATPGAEDTAIHIWDIDYNPLLGTTPTSSSNLYINAKVVLVGNAKVGKTYLSLALEGKPFTTPIASTHACRVCILDNIQVPSAEGYTETHQILLWDLGGQPGYRLMNQLHLNEVAVALVVFNSRSEIDPFEGVYYWRSCITSGTTCAWSRINHH